MKLPRWIVGLLAVALVATACSSSSTTFDQASALRGVDTILAAFKPDSNNQGPPLVTCPFGDLKTIGTALAKASGLTLGTLGKPVNEISPWSNATDGGRAINCAVTAKGFTFSVGVQRGQRDEHPPANAGWKGPSKFGGGNLYYATVSKICSAAWARPGTFFTVGIQIAQASVSASKCEATGKQGVTIVMKSLEKTEPFNVVEPTSPGDIVTGAPNNGSSTASK